MTIAHTGIKAPAVQHTSIVAWYETALAPLGYTKAMAFLDDLVVGFADASGAIDWWISSSAAVTPGAPAPEPTAGADVAKVLPTHTAFVAKDRAAVEAFHQAAVAAGGKCNGKPGIREHYSPSYFAAFVLDPAGNNIEAVCTAEV
ncbi:hypothetical protein B0I37DRAFT_355174 [Chaetomium sp. MPI-CAGE-AT-0009]|nr:hypothetical protein B0I37DRAFT_355174 [Chaetomium sp. MPI-CAGE-AT-0009]